jgi:hypothetical protein
MKVLLMLLLLQVGTQPDLNIKLRDRAQGPTPVTDKDLRPGRAPDCRTEADTMRAVEQVKSGLPGDCWVRDIRAFNQYRG